MTLQLAEQSIPPAQRRRDRIGAAHVGRPHPHRLPVRRGRSDGVQHHLSPAAGFTGPALRVQPVRDPAPSEALVRVGATLVAPVVPILAEPWYS